MNVPLEALGLSNKWPKLDRIQNEIASLERNLSRAQAEAQQATAQLGAAHERDIAAEAKAYRAGKAAPEPVHEPKVQGELEAAERRVAVTQHALQAAREDLGNFLAVHQSALYQDVVNARAGVAERLAGHAGAALSEYGRYQDLARHVKRLRPAEPVNENAPTQRSTYVFAGVHTTRSAGPAPGDVEAMLAYLVSLGAEGEGGANSAA